MEGISNRSSVAKVLAFYTAQEYFSFSREEIYWSLKTHALPETFLELDNSGQSLGNSIALAKLRIARRYLPVFALVPYTRIIFLAGSLACGTPNADSDIDLLVVARSNRVWANRLFLLVISALFGRRRTQRKFKDRFCLNYSLGDRDPTITNQDFASAHFYKHLIPLWCSPQSSIKQFWRANNWIKNYCPNFPVRQQPLAQQPRLIRFLTMFQKTEELLLELTGLGKFFEWFSLSLQKRFILSRLNRTKNNPEGILILEKNRIHYHLPRSHWKEKGDKINKMYRHLLSVENL